MSLLIILLVTVILLLALYLAYVNDSMREQHRKMELMMQELTFARMNEANLREQIRRLQAKS